MIRLGFKLLLINNSEMKHFKAIQRGVRVCGLWFCSVDRLKRKKEKKLKEGGEEDEEASATW